MGNNYINDPFWGKEPPKIKEKKPNRKLKLMLFFNNKLTEIDRGKTRDELTKVIESWIHDYHVLNKNNFKIVKL